VSPISGKSAIPYKPLPRKGLKADPGPSESPSHAVSLSGAVDAMAPGMTNKPSGTQLQNSLDIDLVRAALDADYVILEELGRGGMAVVYRAREKALDREVAIKVLPSFMAIDEAFVERFQHEARTAGKLEHPNIVPIYRVGMAGRVIYFVMKMLKGQSLSTVLRQRPKLGVPEIRRILMETAAALGYAAKHGVVHRDVKPDNILLDDEGRCVVTDFGIAKSSGGPHTAAGTSMGTPRYMSPEHARGHALDGRSDMYSLGVVAYQCLTGITPFDADDPFAILYKHINEPLPKPQLQNHEEQVLFAVIEKMLAKEPKDRFQTADELIMTLGGVAPSTTRTLVTGGRISSAATMQRRSGLSATEIIVTPTFVERIKQATTTITRTAKERPALSVTAAAAAIVLIALGVNAMRDDSSAATPPPAAGSVAAKVPALVDTSRRGATTGVVAGSTTGTKVAAPTDSVTGAPVAPAPPRTTKLGTTPVASRTTIPRRDLSSKCPTSTKVGGFSLLMDSLRAQRPGAQLTVNYDVCGLAQGAPFQTTITLRKENQGPFRRQDPRVFNFLETATSPRSRRQRIVRLAGLSSGEYTAFVLVRNAAGDERGANHGFRILDR
jgi:serine/threonine protein kinase